MPDRDIDAVFYVKDAPEFRFEDGMFHICYTAGKAHFEFVLKPSTYAVTRRRANKAYEKFNGGDVVAIKSKGG